VFKDHVKYLLVEFPCSIRRVPTKAVYPPDERPYVQKIHVRLMLGQGRPSKESCIDFIRFARDTVRNLSCPTFKWNTFIL